MIVLAGSLLVGFVQRAWQEHLLNQAIKQQRADNDEQRARVIFLEGAARYAESDVAVEQAARVRLGMAREGETVLLPTMILPKTTTTGPLETETLEAFPAVAAEKRRSEPNVVRWLHILFPGSNAVP